MSSECQLLERRAWDSSFQEIEVKEHVTLLPSYLGRVRQGVVELLSGRVLLYHSVYDGVLVSFSHVRILKRAGHIIDELPHIHMDIVYSATVFKPQVGAVMCGSVSMVGVDHVGCLVYNCFNVSVICTATTRLEGAPGCQSKAQKKKRWRSWCRRPFLVGEDVWFTVTGVEVTGSILAMRGEYMVVGEEGGGGGRVMVNSVDSSETSRDSAAVEESQSQPNMKHLSKKKIKKKKKCKNQRHKRVSGEDSGSESFSGKRKKKRRLEGEGREASSAAMSALGLSLMEHGGPSAAPSSKRQKMTDGSASFSSLDDGNLSDDEDMVGGRAKAAAGGGSKLTTEAKRSQHCEVEKRRRERMNRYMNELAQMIPTCAAVPRRLDKLSILKMAVDHMKSLRGDPHTSSAHRPGFLTDDELKHLVVEAANGFMVIIECSWARVLFVSDTIQDVLGEAPDNWMGSTFYDLLHPKDVPKVKSQLTCFDLEEALKASVKNNASSSPLVIRGQTINGLRRSFLCRVKRGTPSDQPTNGEAAGGGSVDYQRSEDVIRLLQSTQQNIEQQFAVLHCTGFIRHLTSSEQQALKMEEGSSGACLIAVARLQHFGDGSPRATMEASENEFVARVGTDGRYTYVDPRVVGVLGYLPQDLIGQVSYEYYHPEDIQKMVQLHHDAMKRRTPMPTVQYRVLSKAQKWVWLAMKAFSFINPFSQQVEYVVCTNVAMRVPTGGESAGDKAPPSQPLPPSSASTTAVERYSSAQAAAQQTTPQGGVLAGLGGVGGGGEDDPLSVLFPDLAAAAADVMQPHPPAEPSSSSQQSMMSWSQASLLSAPSSSSPSSLPLNVASSYSLPPSAPLLTSPADTSLEENAATAKRVLEQYQQHVAPPPHRKDLNMEFPPGLFPPEKEINLEDSHQAYQILQAGLEDPTQFIDLFTQVEADPFRQQHMLGDIDLLD